MDYVCCLPAKQYANDDTINDNDEEIHVVMGKAKVCYAASAEASEFHLELLTLTDGSNIFEIKECDKGRITLYTTDEAEKKQLSEYVWYELMVLLSGHAIKIDRYQGHVEFTSWQCYIYDDTKWSLVMELESKGLMKKIAELVLVPAGKNVELDLFELSSNLFRAYSLGNDNIHNLKQQNKELRDQLKQLKAERTELDEILERRDNQTRQIVSDLLNFKKQKILSLQNALDDLTKQPQLGLDSELINKHVYDEIAELNSPGKRRKLKTTQSSPLKDLKARDLLKELKEEEAIKNKEQNMHDKFIFYGIKKVKDENEDLKSALSKYGSSDEDSHSHKTHSSYSASGQRNTLGHIIKAEKNIESMEDERWCKAETPKTSSESATDTDG